MACSCLQIDSTIYLGATGNTNPSQNSYVEIQYTDCNGFTQYYYQTSGGVFYLCTQSGAIDKVTFFRDDVQYDTTSPYGWIPFPAEPSITFTYSYNSVCTGDPCGPGVSPTPTATPTPTPTPCTCNYIDVTITQNDIDSASGNTNPSLNGVVYYQYNTCQSPSPMVDEPYTVAGTYSNSVCVLSTQIAFTLFYYYQNDVVVDSLTSPFTSSYVVGGCCAPPTSTPTQTPTNTATPSVTPTEPYDVYLFQDCCNPSNIFRIQNVPGILNVGEIWNINNVSFVGCATVIAYSATGSIYNGGTFTGPYGDCNTCGVCPSPTPTPTPTSSSTPTPTPTPTITPSPGSCSTTYCFKTTLSSLSGYSGNYVQTGTYNTKYYYSGDGINSAVVYYTGDRWCLSTSLGGSCLLEGSHPCYSECPDISANLFNAGPCPTPTPSPVNCDTFDFTAYFDCDWEPIPTPTPSIPCDDVDFDVTATYLPPTPTPTNPCNVGVSFNVCAINPSPTPTNTPTVTLTKTCEVAGQVSFVMLDETFNCVSVKVLVDCVSGTEYYVTDNLMYNGIPVPSGITMSAVVNGSNVCVTYERDDSNMSSNSVVTSVSELYTNCGTCAPNPTPSQTTTTTPTPTLTPTPTSSIVPTITPTNTPTTTVTPSVTATPGLTPSATPTMTSTVTPTSTITPTITPTNTSTPTMTPTVTPSPVFVYIYESCSPITPNVLPTQVVQTIQSPITMIIGETFKDVDQNCWKYVGQFPSSYIVPPTYIPVTFNGDYFATAFPTVYVDCQTCLTTPTCYEYGFENITTATGHSTAIRLGSYSDCPGYSHGSTAYDIGDTACIHSTTPLTSGLPNAVWSDGFIPGPVYGVDYTLTLNGCP